MGNKPESELYVKLKKKACDEIGIGHEGIVLPEYAKENEIIETVTKMQ